jgi:hypothetical protein
MQSNMRCILFTLTLFVLPLASIAGSIDDPSKASSDWDWKPWWRDRNDCGPLCLYALFQLEGKEVSIKEIKNLTPLDGERGCSLDDLRRAAEKLGMPVEVRYVKPSDLINVPCPYILHGHASLEKNTGHFLVVVDYNKHEKLPFTIIDPSYDDKIFMHNEDAILKSFSGYVLVPKKAFANWSDYLLIIICGICFSISLYCLVRYRQKANRRL